MNITPMRRTQFPKSQRGSLLIVAMIFAAIIGISLASYLQLGRTTLNISNRALYNNAAINLAEQGIEEAMYSINRYVAAPTYSWTGAGWTLATPNARQKWSAIPLGQNATAEYRVYIYDYVGVSSPKIVSRATVSLGSGGAPIEKWIEVTLERTSKFANGLVARNSIVFNGNNATVDSWNSERNPDGTPRGSPVPFSSAVRRDNGTVGSISIASDAVLVKNADVWGYVSNNSKDPVTGAEVDPATFVGSTGSILGADSPSGTNVDPNRTATTFSATTKPVSLPTTSFSLANLGVINTNGLVLPLPGDTTPNGTGEYAGFYVYDAARIDLTGKKITVDRKAVLRLSSTATSFDVGGGDGEIAITSAGTLVVFTEGTVSLAGKGVSNGTDGIDAGTDVDQVSELGQPKQFRLYGTKTSGSQSITIAGSGLFSGVIYAPQGDVKITGNGAVCGSVVANDITLNGNAQFHYDESLAELDGGEPFRVSKWKELTTAADRDSYAPVLSW